MQQEPIAPYNLYNQVRSKINKIKTFISTIIKMLCKNVKKSYNKVSKFLIATEWFYEILMRSMKMNAKEREICEQTDKTIMSN